jgi:Ni,Fe-hydrogenase III large subunit
MIPVLVEKEIDHLSEYLGQWLKVKGRRIGLLTSIDGGQLATLLLDPRDASSEICISPIQNGTYRSLSKSNAQFHWFERSLHDLFGIVPQGHPRLKPCVLNESYEGPLAPLRSAEQESVHLPHLLDRAHVYADAHEHVDKKITGYLSVKGDGVYEIPVGPVHAGIIEPGHFRLSCIGEQILNLEVRLGFLHRGLESKFVDLPYHKVRFFAEAAATDTTAANALASAQALEGLFPLEVSARAKMLRGMALEVERLGMHIVDLSGMAVDLGFGAMAAALSRLRAQALRLADLLSGTRFMRGFILPGGVARDPDINLRKFAETLRDLKREVLPLLKAFLLDNALCLRLKKLGVLSTSLANEFGMVGVVARASGVDYDVRKAFPEIALPELIVAHEKSGDAFARISVRAQEVATSIVLLEKWLEELPAGPCKPEKILGVGSDLNAPANSYSFGIVEAFRGELIHLVATDESGAIMRYCIKDPSFNNWTGLAITVRNNLVQNFPMCNKSFALSYSGHDL